MKLKVLAASVGLFLFLVIACRAPELPTALPQPSPPTATEQPSLVPSATLEPVRSPTLVPPGPTIHKVPVSPTPPATGYTRPQRRGYPYPGATGTPIPSQSRWVPDGLVHEGEYAHQIKIGSIGVWWYNDDMYLYVALEAETTGWVGIGFDPEDRMKGANYVIGAVEGDRVLAWDAYGRSPVGADHPRDTKLGGQDNIVAYGGSEAAGVTRFEFQIPLDSGDTYDKPLSPGKVYTVVVAAGSSDAFSARHIGRGVGEIQLD